MTNRSENALDAEGLTCNGCGQCCLKHGADLPLSAADVTRWREEHPDILRFVNQARSEIWVDPGDARRLNRCPWLELRDGDYTCGIYEHRPDACRSYPFSLLQAAWDDCEALPLALQESLR